MCKYLDFSQDVGGIRQPSSYIYIFIVKIMMIHKQQKY